MSFHFVNVVSSDQSISSDIRSHVMHDFIRRKQSKENHERSRLRLSKQNKTESRVGKLIPKKIIFSNHPLEPHNTWRTSIMPIGSPRSRVSAVAIVSHAPVQDRQNPPQATTTAVQRAREYDNSRYSRALSTIHVPRSTFEDALAVKPVVTLHACLLEWTPSSAKSNLYWSIGSGIDPFHVLPQLPNTLINIERLKWHCKRPQRTQ